MATPEATPVTADNAAFVFYDIESLNNAFTMCLFDRNRKVVHVMYLIDEPYAPLNSFTFQDAAQRIRAANPAMDDSITLLFHDLRTFEANRLLAQMVGLSDADDVNDPASFSSYNPEYAPVCDTDPKYDPFHAHPYICGYNSLSYDTTILALYLHDAFEQPRRNTQFKPAVPEHLNYQPASAARIREHNDQLFSHAYKKNMPVYLREALDDGWNSGPNKIRQAMLNSGRHLDVARFNESPNVVGLKRLLGGLGRQILESDKLSGPQARVDTVDELYELLAYNVSDVIGLAQLFAHEKYSSNFDLRKSLLDEYPETIYDASRGTSKPMIAQNNVRKFRLTPDATSAKFAAIILAPYVPLEDMPVVDLTYPHPDIAKEWGMTPTNVLEDTKQFFYDNITDPDARAKFDLVYKYYKSIQGQNFNNKYDDDAPQLADIQRYPNNIPYFDANGQPTTAFATFSTGGIHGAEADVTAYHADLAEYQYRADMIALAKHHFPDPTDLVEEARRQHNLLYLPDGTTVEKDMVLMGAKPETAKWRSVTKQHPERQEPLERIQRFTQDPVEALSWQRPDENRWDVTLADGTFIDGKLALAKTSLKAAEYRDEPTGTMPELFEQRPDGWTKLKNKYVYTSAAFTFHEDFTSYYPNLLRGLNAFYNPDLGEDRYAKIFFQKEEYGAMLKDPSIPAEEKAKIKVLYEGTKLILNAASGAGDTPYKNNIKMNNTIITMRILGQLFSWRIGQAQTLAGATIISTNTDGLYSTGLGEATNDRVLQEQAAATGIEIEPEPMYVISKDSNNRLELAIPDGQPMWEAEVMGASGATLGGWEGPQPTKSHTQPVVLDRALMEYLRLIAAEANPPWRREAGRAPLNLNEPLCLDTGMQLLQDIRTGQDPVMALRFFQQMVAGSTTSLRFPFLADPIDTEDQPLENLRTLQLFSRVFFVKEGTDNAASLHIAGVQKVPPKSQEKRARDGIGVQTDPQVMSIMQQLGYERDRLAAQATGHELLPADHDVVRRKVGGVEPTWNVIVDNRDLYTLPEQETQWILDNLDLDVYVQMLAARFDNNWQRKNTPATANTVQ